jgi:flagellar FliJ protein
MTQHTALDSLIQLARGQRDGALARFAAAMSDARTLGERLAVLLSYRSEYAARLAEGVSGGITAQRLRAFRLFLDNLDLAIRQQQQAILAQNELQSLRRADWAHTESRLKGYATLRDRRQAVRATRALRDEQRGSDEHAQRAAARRKIAW